MSQKLEKKPEHLWQDRSYFSPKDMLLFAESMKQRILSSMGSEEITFDHLSAWVRKEKKTRG